MHAEATKGSQDLALTERTQVTLTPGSMDDRAYGDQPTIDPPSSSAGGTSGGRWGRSLSVSLPPSRRKPADPEQGSVAGPRRMSRRGPK